MLGAPKTIGTVSTTTPSDLDDQIRHATQVGMVVSRSSLALKEAGAPVSSPKFLRPPNKRQRGVT